MDQLLFFCAAKCDSTWLAYGAAIYDFLFSIWRKSEVLAEKAAFIIGMILSVLSKNKANASQEAPELRDNGRVYKIRHGHSKPNVIRYSRNLLTIG
ncbi:hypothetical protein DVH26_36380 [Paenibacillus sp. H1-7]|nr:hypothetical protein DVH26_36380 [Paenibacillus sp. H1-7]